MNANTSVRQSNQQSDVVRLVMKSLLQVIVLLPFLAALVFIPAGRLNWAMAWILLGTYLVGLFVTSLLVGLRDPELAKERTEVPEDAKRWDRKLVTLLNAMFFLVVLPLAGLDARFGWSSLIHLAVQLVALVVFILGFGLFDWAMLSNRFFSAILRIQEDRGHTVVSGGPYRYVRHPGYVAMTAMCLAMPLVLASLWALIPAALSALLCVLRTALEDKTLQEELGDYKDYAQRVRYRLLPGIW